MKILFFTLLMILGLESSAQDGKYQISENDYANNSVEMADTMRQNGKIYVVVAVVMTIFVGMIFYMVRIEKKVNRLEKDLEEEKN